MAEKIVKDSQGLAKDLVNDCISRSGVSAWLANMGYRGLANKVMDEDRFPSAQPERKRGRWKIIMARHKYNGEYREVRQCSECHAAYFHYANQEDIEDEIPNFCPNCGAMMKGADDGTR